MKLKLNIHGILCLRVSVISHLTIYTYPERNVLQKTAMTPWLHQRELGWGKQRGKQLERGRDRERCRGRGRVGDNDRLR